MQAKTVMIPLSMCAKVARGRTIYDAITMLESIRKISPLEYRPRVVFVHDDDFKIVGYVRPYELLVALGNTLPRDAFSSWHSIVQLTYQVIHTMPVEDVMYRFSEEEYVTEETSIEEIFFKMVSSSFSYLTVTSGKLTIGIIRQTDVFNILFKELKQLK